MTQELRFVYVRKPGTLYGGITVAFTPPRRVGEKMVEFSISTCSKKDVFVKKTGRSTAALNYLTGRRLQAATEEGWPVSAQLRYAMQVFLELAVPEGNDDEQRLHKSRQKERQRLERKLQAREPAPSQQGQTGSPSIARAGEGREEVVAEWQDRSRYDSF